MHDRRAGRAGLEAVVGPVLRIEVKPATGVEDDLDTATELADLPDDTSETKSADEVPP